MLGEVLLTDHRLEHAISGYEVEAPACHQAVREAREKASLFVRELRRFRNLGEIPTDHGLQKLGT
jgi:hypothetical protein